MMNYQNNKKDEYGKKVNRSIPKITNDGTKKHYFRGS